jgi:membrane fusion protein
MYAAAAGALAMAASLAIVAVFGSVTRKAHLAGVIVPRDGTLVVQAPAAGVVTDLRVSEGQQVTAGELLLTIDTERLSSGGQGVQKTQAEVAQIVQARLSALRQQGEVHRQNFKERDHATSERARLLNDQLAHAREEENLLTKRVELARESLHRHEALAQTGFISQMQIQTRLDELLEARSRLQASKRTILSLKGERGAADFERASSANQLALQLAEISRAEELAKQELLESSARAKAAVIAPIDGTIAATDLVNGFAVHAGQSMLTLIPAREGNTRAEGFVAHLYAPSRSAGFAREGQAVQLRIDAFPFQKFGFIAGRVRKVSKAPFAPTDLPPTVAQQLASRNIGRDSGLFRLVVELERPIGADGVSLKAGDTLEADVNLETRAVWEWMFESLLRMRRWL